jgi:hypothetical protein
MTLLRSPLLLCGELVFIYFSPLPMIYDELRTLAPKLQRRSTGKGE